MKRLWLLFVTALLLAGCAAAEHSYVFGVQFERPEEWTQVYPASRDTQPLKYLLMNDRTGGRIAFFSHSTFYRTPENVASELKVRFAQADFNPTEIVYGPDGRAASFRIAHPRTGMKGKVVVLRPTGIGRCIVAIGRWPAAADAQATADMDAVLKDIEIWTEH
ncbi:MAG: hypothetical protein RL272_788 [Candidatus Parcubacteria bacterium]|jgi:hypothetical protein